MIGGCLRNLFAMVGCAVVLLVGGVVAWQYRVELRGVYRSVVEGRVAEAVPAGADSVGRASRSALESAREKQDAMARSDGPSAVVLSASELAALIEWGLGPLGAAALDSLTVRLETDRLRLQALLDTRIFADELAGPLAGVLDPREPLTLAGPARVAGVGVVAWEPDAFVVRSFPFPSAAVPRLVDRLTGGTGGALPIAVPPTVGDVRIRPDGVTFYRRID